ncbi:MAG: AIM24 family protein [Lachnospiraceae bacterium]|nr:AIM24 family protein [Lachnospiraceae bacterium]
MAIRFSNFLGQNKNLEILEQKGPFTVFHHLEDLSTTPSTAQTKFFMAQTNCTVKQLLARCPQGIKTQAGAMQLMVGSLEMTTGVKGVGDLVGKAFKGKASGESTIKPEYKGSGWILCEPTYKFLLLEDLADWNGSLVCDDGMFYAAELSVKDTIQMRQNLSSVAGGKGLFNCLMKGQGIVALESYYPRNELYTVDIQNDVLKVDGSNVVCWSGTLQFTVERSGKTLVGSAVSGEGLVNVYRGTGRVLMAPRT